MSSPQCLLGSISETIAVVLPDGSMELHDTEHMSVRSLLSAFPEHVLRAADDPEQPTLHLSYKLKRGMTYYLFAGKWEAARWHAQGDVIGPLSGAGGAREALKLKVPDNAEAFFESMSAKSTSGGGVREQARKRLMRTGSLTSASTSSMMSVIASQSPWSGQQHIWPQTPRVSCGESAPPSVSPFMQPQQQNWAAHKKHIQRQQSLPATGCLETCRDASPALSKGANRSTALPSPNLSITDCDPHDEDTATVDLLALKTPSDLCEDLTGARPKVAKERPTLLSCFTFRGSKANLPRGLSARSNGKTESSKHVTLGGNGFMPKCGT